jgi:hypothetical protein
MCGLMQKCASPAREARGRSSNLPIAFYNTSHPTQPPHHQRTHTQETTPGRLPKTTKRQKDKENSDLSRRQREKHVFRPAAYVIAFLDWCPKIPPHSSGPWTPGAPAEVLASRGDVVVESWQAVGVIFVVGKAVLTLHPPLRPLSHNANPRDGAQDIERAMALAPYIPLSGSIPGLRALSLGAGLVAAPVVAGTRCLVAVGALAFRASAPRMEASCMSGTRLAISDGQLNSCATSRRGQPVFLLCWDLCPIS